MIAHRGALRPQPPAREPDPRDWAQQCACAEWVGCSLPGVAGDARRPRPCHTCRVHGESHPRPHRPPKSHPSAVLSSDLDWPQQLASEAHLASVVFLGGAGEGAARSARRQRWAQGTGRPTQTRLFKKLISEICQRWKFCGIEEALGGHKLLLPGQPDSIGFPDLSDIGRGASQAGLRHAPPSPSQEQH